jgi:hypothetical protein
MSNVFKFPTKISQPVPGRGPYFCGKPLDNNWDKPKRGRSSDLVRDVAEIYSAIPADLDRGQAAFVYVTTVLQFSRQILRKLSSHDLGSLNLMVEAAGEAGRSSDLDEIDILGDMVNDELERRGGDTVA